MLVVNRVMLSMSGTLVDDRRFGVHYYKKFHRHDRKGLRWRKGIV